MGLHERVGQLAAALASLGGGVLLLLVGLTCASIAGRSLGFAGLGPIPGDFELVELGIAFSVFSFLPWCQHAGGHARVDLFRASLGERGSWLSDVLSDSLMLVFSVLIAWRLWAGMVDKLGYTETTFVLRLPLGWGYAACLPGAVGFAVVSASCLLKTIALRRPRPSPRAAR